GIVSGINTTSVLGFDPNNNAGTFLMYGGDTALGDPNFFEIVARQSNSTNSHSGTLDFYGDDSRSFIGLTSSDGAAQPYIDLFSWAGNADFSYGIDLNNKTILLPGAPDGTAPFRFYTDFTHASGNLFECGNSNALKAAIR